MPRRISLGVRRAAAALLALPAVATTLAISVAPVSAQALPSGAGCDVPLLARPQPAADVAAQSPTTLAAVAKRHDQSAAELGAAATDHSLWLDRCGQQFFVEPIRDTQQAAQQAAPSAATAPPGLDVLTLQSSPGSDKTLYLDFIGSSITGTGWNQNYSLPTITAETFSLDTTVSATFSTAERNAIYQAWLVVAEDYAPFAINVTTQDLGESAIQRTSSADLVYGSRVQVTNAGAVYNACGCAGVAYLGVFGTTGSTHDYYQPAWAFADGVGGSGVDLGLVISHESGHNFGLSHDGQGTSAYYSGSGSWGPIMGAPYGRAVAQWSKGEYTGATKTEDDLAIIGAEAPLRADDLGNTAATATPLTEDATLSGLISTRTDVDAFIFSAAGATTLTALSTTVETNLNLEMRILDAAGATVATLNPAGSTRQAMGAVWSTTLPAEPATYTALIDGVGTGNPLTAGIYSDYASLGGFQLTLDTTLPSATPLTVAAGDPVVATVGVPFAATPITATGGTSPYAWGATGLPDGVAINPSTGEITGTVAAALAGQAVEVTVTDAVSATASASFTLVVQVAPPTPPVVPDQTFTTLLRVGKAYATSLTSSAVAADLLTWSADAPPPGLTLSLTGVLSGTPTQAGTFTFTATATRVDAPVAADSGVITVVVKPPHDPLLITTLRLPGARIGKAYDAGVARSGGVPRFTWTVKGALPKGLKVRIGTKGRSVRVVGIPTTAGKFTFKLKVRDATGVASSRSFTVQVRR